MEPEHLRFGGGPTETVLHPLVVIAVLVAISLIFLLPRKHVIVPLLLTAFLIPVGQMLVVGGIHLMVLRIVFLFGWVRLVWSKLSSQRVTLSGGFNSIDSAFSLCYVFYALAFTLLWMEKQALINRLGFLWDVFGVYFLLRFLIEDNQDVHRVINLFAIIAAIMALCMLNEQLTHLNIFGLLGGVRRVPEVRDGRIRSQAVFQHSILAGTFGATLLPLLAWLWKSGKCKMTAIIGMISTTVVTVATGSSTTVLTFISGIGALCLWPLRKRMRIIRFGIVITLVGLHLVMKAPVWALIGRAEVWASSSGYHRYALVDHFIRGFGDWWLLGSRNYDTWGWDMWDLTNQYVAMGLGGGLVTFIYFLAIISRSFRRLGTVRRLVEGDRKQEWFVWSLAAALFAHVVAFFGISYFDQMQVAWFALLAMISVAAAPRKGAIAQPAGSA